MSRGSRAYIYRAAFEIFGAFGYAREILRLSPKCFGLFRMGLGLMDAYKYARGGRILHFLAIPLKAESRMYVYAYGWMKSFASRRGGIAKSRGPRSRYLYAMRMSGSYAGSLRRAVQTNASSPI